MRPRLGIAVVCVAASLQAARAAAPSLADLKVSRDGEVYAASCRLQDGLTPELLEEIAAGLETTIEYRLHVCRRRAGWPDQVVVKRRVACTVRHDALARQYTLTRRIDGDLQDSRVTAEPEAMRQFLTTLQDVPLIKAAELPAGEEHYLKAKSNLGLVWRFYLIPWPFDTAWARAPIGHAEGSGVGTQP
jgi:hypothetical protein